MYTDEHLLYAWFHGAGREVSPGCIQIGVYCVHGSVGLGEGVSCPVSTSGGDRTDWQLETGRHMYSWGILGGSLLCLNVSSALGGAGLR